MRVVIDTNRLESEELRVFLSADPRNIAVLPEHTLTEIFKPRNLTAVYRAHDVVRDFVRQVLILKANQKIREIDPNSPAITNRFVDRLSTKTFPKFCAALAEAERGDQYYVDQFRLRQDWANERAEATLDAIGNQIEELAELRSQFRPDDLKKFRLGNPLTQHFRSVMLQAVFQLSSHLYPSPTARRALPAAPARYYDFRWRYALCHIVSMVELLRRGATQRKPEKGRNDHYDNVFATFGTYFNGLMTADRGPLLTQSVARLILGSLGARLAPDYTDTRYIFEMLDRIHVDE